MAQSGGRAGLITLHRRVIRSFILKVFSLPGEVGHAWQQPNQSPIGYTMESKKIIIDLKRLPDLIMEISSSCFTLIGKEYIPDETRIAWHSFLFVSKNEYRLTVKFCQVLSGKQRNLIPY